MRAAAEAAHTHQALLRDGPCRWRGRLGLSRSGGGDRAQGLAGACRRAQNRRCSRRRRRCCRRGHGGSLQCGGCIHSGQPGGQHGVLSSQRTLHVQRFASAPFKGLAAKLIVLRQSALIKCQTRLLARLWCWCRPPPGRQRGSAAAASQRAQAPTDCTIRFPSHSAFYFPVTASGLCGFLEAGEHAAPASAAAAAHSGALVQRRIGHSDVARTSDRQPIR